jgi:hypothetical protein
MPRPAALHPAKIHRAAPPRTLWVNMPIWVRPSSPSVNGCRPSAMLIEQPASVRSSAKCATCAIYARSPDGQASLRPRPAGHASLPGDTPASSLTPAPPPQSHRTFSSSSPLAFPLQNRLFSLHISPAPNPTSLRFHIALRPLIIAITPPYKGASPMALFNLWLVLVHFLSKRSV